VVEVEEVDGVVDGVVVVVVGGGVSGVAMARRANCFWRLSRSPASVQRAR
jgi:hypothetical protein